MLSGNATRVLELLNRIPGGKVCIPCAGAQFDLDRHEVLKSLRELVVAGHIIHGLFHCSCCGRVDLVAMVRGSRFQNTA